MLRAEKLHRKSLWAGQQTLQVRKVPEARSVQSRWKDTGSETPSAEDRVVGCTLSRAGYRCQVPQAERRSYCLSCGPFIADRRAAPAGEWPITVYPHTWSVFGPPPPPPRPQPLVPPPAAGSWGLWLGGGDPPLESRGSAGNSRDSQQLVAARALSRSLRVVGLGDLPVFAQRRAASSTLTHSHAEIN